MYSPCLASKVVVLVAQVLVLVTKVLVNILLNIMHKVKALRSGELYVKNMLILLHNFAMLDLEAAD